MKALLDEAADRGADPVAVVGKDGGVRNGQAERVAKQGGDREPVGKPADDPGFGGGAHEQGGEVVSAESAGRDEDEHHRAEKRGRQRAVAPQRGDPHELAERSDDASEKPFASLSATARDNSPDSRFSA